MPRMETRNVNIGLDDTVIKMEFRGGGGAAPRSIYSYKFLRQIFVIWANEQRKHCEGGRNGRSFHIASPPYVCVRRPNERTDEHVQERGDDEQLVLCLSPLDAQPEFPNGICLATY